MVTFLMTLSDLDLLATPNHPVFYVYTAFHIFITGVDRDFKCDYRLTTASLSLLMISLL